ncbi:MAG TPA: glycosyltransferase [Thermoplasmata archaeon]|nr:glycosyltransferase [Thermoplasmata archaeon]
MSAPSRWIAGGVPAFQTGPRLRESVRSLLAQRLPEGTAWSGITVVVSGASDDTLAVAQALAREDPRVSVVHQPRREGKASALRAIFAEARGDALVLLNGDATARPGAVEALLGAAPTPSGPFAVMGRPCPPAALTRGLGRGIEVLWELHHRVHRATLEREDGNHLSDELWLLPLPVPSPLPAGVVNDGAFVGAWLRENGGRLFYAPAALVEIEVPRTPAEHLRQRRRISWGNHQVRDLLGVHPTTWFGYARGDPPGAVRLLVSTLRDYPRAVLSTFLLAALELEAVLLAGWDRHVVVRDHVLWEIVAPDGATSPLAAARRTGSERRAAPEGG